MIGYEYYYLFGVDIPLDNYKLGVIKQPRLYDFIKSGISIEEFYMPFLMNDYIISQVEDKDKIIGFRDALGSLKFFLNTYGVKNKGLRDFKASLRLLYGNVDIIINSNSVIVGEAIIDNNNFDLLCSIVIEMLRIDKSSVDFEKNKKKPMSEIEMEFEKRRLKYEEQTKKKKKEKGLTILDIANVVSNSHVYKYEDVLNMTIYQIKNSYEVINIKEAYETEVLYKISPKFEIKNDKNEHWTEKIKLDKSTLSR